MTLESQVQGLLASSAACGSLLTAFLFLLRASGRFVKQMLTRFDWTYVLARL
jgi:hypothetical protein